jgi:hypothetical protein
MSYDILISFIKTRHNKNMYIIAMLMISYVKIETGLVMTSAFS